MHLLLIHQAFVSPKQAGGTRHYEFAQRCLKSGLRFTIAASNVSYLDGRRTSIKNRIVSSEIFEGIVVLRAYTYPALHKSFVWRVVSFLSFMLTSVIAGLRTKDVDIVLGTSPPIFQAISAWLVAKLKGKPLLFEVRDLWPEFAIEMKVLKNPVLIWLSRLVERFLYAQATHLIVNSPAYRDYLLNKGIKPKKISLIPNGVDPDLFDPDCEGNGFRTEYRLESKVLVTYAGALGMANDITTILNAADLLKTIKSIHFVIVGDGKERQQLEATKLAMGLDNVTFIGAQPKSDMPRVLAASHICLATLMNIPMFKTTYPNKVFDYMAAGRPTVLAIDGVIRNVIEKANGGIFVQPGDALALAEAVKQLYQKSDDRKAMGASAHNYVIRHFNRNHQAQMFIDLIGSL